MNPDLIRLILIIAGVLLILGIYLWDRHKKDMSDNHAIREAQAPGLPAEGDQEFGMEAHTKVEPVWNSEEKAAVNEHSDSLPNHASAGVALYANDESEAGLDTKKQIDQAQFSFTAEGGQQESQDEKIPFRIFQINIVAKSGRFSGEKILEVTKKVGLRYGDMNIFHYYTGSTMHAKVLFSMTSMVEPGIFPSASLEDYSTPGLTLFTQLPGPMESLTIFSKMLSTAEDIASALDASLQDETHSDLTKQTIEHMRAEIRELHRQVQLARSRQ